MKCRIVRVLVLVPVLVLALALVFASKPEVDVSLSTTASSTVELRLREASDLTTCREARSARLDSTLSTASGTTPFTKPGPSAQPTEESPELRTANREAAYARALSTPIVSVLTTPIAVADGVLETAADVEYTDGDGRFGGWAIW